MTMKDKTNNAFVFTERVPIYKLTSGTNTHRISPQLVEALGRDPKDWFAFRDQIAKAAERREETQKKGAGSSADVKERAKKPRVMAIELPKDEYHFFKTVLSFPLLPVSYLYKAAGWSDCKGQKQKEALVDKRLCAPMTLSTKRGQDIKLLNIPVSMLNIKVNEKKIIEMFRHISGGSAHSGFQVLLETQGKHRGFEVSCDKVVDGKAADCLYKKNGRMVAFEVALSPVEHEFTVNILGDLKAGYDRIIMCCQTKDLSRDLEDRARQELSEEEFSNLRFCLLSELLPKMKKGTGQLLLNVENADSADSLLDSLLKDMF